MAANSRLPTRCGGSKSENQAERPTGIVKALAIGKSVLIFPSFFSTFLSIARKVFDVLLVWFFSESRVWWPWLMGF